ncbi:MULTISPECIES: cation-translocating P-type ATPase [Rhodomicrobium]|uniref:cation-translocating P-type ATPase n=1 Tax=Rhodomicrobium TaxID=1068 RepID=UPI000B4B361D|nr:MULTISPECIES: cation-translocating P-type ATPase [Rhodomicrobium]
MTSAHPHTRAKGGRRPAVPRREPARGLSSTEAAARLARDGPNALPAAAQHSIFAIARDVLREPMLMLLLAAGGIYLALGDRAEALLIICLASATVVISILQQIRSERVLEQLSRMSDPRPLVIRDSKPVNVAIETVVRGDALVLREGNRVAADAELIESHAVEADESLLTGESVPVGKHAAPGGTKSEQSRVYAGTLIVRGQGVAIVTATGTHSAMGRIGKTLSEIETEAPPLRQQIRGVIFVFAAGGIVMSALAFLLNGLLRGEWLQGVLGGIALSMALLPEEFPVVLTVFLVMGAWRISKVRVLTRKASAIETLGAATVLCTDKTGTLTENRMAVAEMRIGARVAKPRSGQALNADFQELMRAAILASEPQPSDPMEKAFLAWTAQVREHPAAAGAALAKRYPLEPDLPALTHVWRSKSRGVVAAKGAPEAIARLCGLDAARARDVHAAVEAMAARGLRVLGVAMAPDPAGPLPERPDGFAFAFLGLIGLEDPLRPGVPEAVAECRGAGIRVIMITGDHPATALAIAGQAGIGSGAAMTGAELDKLSDAELAQHVASVAVFARTKPEQKLRIVAALKANGEVVAMTGDGVNDAPALKAAHIGIAMGQRGTAVAREASSIVLLDDNFNSIVRTIRLGRRIYDNLRKAICFVTAAHVPIAGLALMPLLFGLPLLLMPVHIAFIEMIIDPVSSLGYEAEPEEKGVMQRPPRATQEPLLPLRLIGWGLFQGVMALAAVAAVFVVALNRGLPEDEVRALAFAALVACNFAIVLANRALRSSLAASLLRPNPLLWLALGVNLAVLCLLFLLPQASRLFRFGPLHAHDAAIAAGAGLALLGVFGVAKRLWRPV